MLNDWTTWWTAWWEHHSAEVWIGLVLAIVIGLLIEYLKKFKFTKYLHKKIRQICCGNEKIIQRNEIDKTTKSKFHPTVPHNQIAAVIELHKALVTRAPFYYTNRYRNYRTQRLLKVLQLLNGQDSFFSELCQAMSASLPSNGFDLCLSLQKETNRLFASEFARNLLGRVRSHSIVYDEKRMPFWRFLFEVLRNFWRFLFEVARNLLDRERSHRRKEFTFWPSGRRHPKLKYEQGDSLQGVKVILLESFLLFPESLMQTIEWLTSEGAIISKVVILFASTEDQALFSSCGIEVADVIVGCSIDLGLTASLTDTPPQPTGRPIVLKYCKY